MLVKLNGERLEESNMKPDETDCTGRASQTATAPFATCDMRDLIVGGHTLVPTLDGSLHPYINLDNAASTPIARPVKEKVDEFLEWYAGVHRGSGFKSQLSTNAYEQARERVAHFVGADLSEHTCIFVRNTTEAINRCAGRIHLGPNDVVLTTPMEHHSNLLAWRIRQSRVIYIDIDELGAPSLSNLQAKLEAYKGHVKMVAISGGSNVTGIIPDVQAIAGMAHDAGAQLLVDAAQLAPHRPINMGPVGALHSIDFLAMSAHKMYAPLGAGALIGPTEAFKGDAPCLVGGGTVTFVSEDEVSWNNPPDNEEAGSPNVVGAIAMAAATRFLSNDLGWDWLVQHERDLTSYALQRMNEIPGLLILGPRDPSLPQDRLGVISFVMESVDYPLIAAVFSNEYAIATRTGRFCAQPYLMRLFHLSPERIHNLRDEMSRGDNRHAPGATRISFGFYNSREDIDAAVDALWNMHRGKLRGQYRHNVKNAEYCPVGSSTQPEGWFDL